MHPNVLQHWQIIGKILAVQQFGFCTQAVTQYGHRHPKKNFVRIEASVSMWHRRHGLNILNVLGILHQYLAACLPRLSTWSRLHQSVSFTKDSTSHHKLRFWEIREMWKMWWASVLCCNCFSHRQLLPSFDFVAPDRHMVHPLCLRRTHESSVNAAKIAWISSNIWLM